MDSIEVERIAPGVIVSTALFDAPRARVFEAWTDPATLARWWGPRGFTNAFELHEPRPGGAWRFVMRGPDGKEWRNHLRYEEVVPPERVVLRHVNGPLYLSTYTFEDEGGKTRVRWRHEFDNPTFLESNAALILASNRENLEKLAAVL